MEKTNRVSAFDILQERVMMPDLWIYAEQPTASRGEITRRKIKRIFRGMLERFGLSSCERSEVFASGQRVEMKR